MGQGKGVRVDALKRVVAAWQLVAKGDRHYFLHDFRQGPASHSSVQGFLRGGAHLSPLEKYLPPPEVAHTAIAYSPSLMIPCSVNFASP